MLPGFGPTLSMQPTSQSNTFIAFERDTGVFLLALGTSSTTSRLSRNQCNIIMQYSTNWTDQLKKSLSSDFFTHRISWNRACLGFLNFMRETHSTSRVTKSSRIGGGCCWYPESSRDPLKLDDKSDGGSQSEIGSNQARLSQYVMRLPRPNLWGTGTTFGTKFRCRISAPICRKVMY